jgi:hypothetical protein
MPRLLMGAPRLAPCAQDPEVADSCAQRELKRRASLVSDLATGLLNPPWHWRRLVGRSQRSEVEGLTAPQAVAMIELRGGAVW